MWRSGRRKRRPALATGPGRLWTAYASGSGASALITGGDVVAADWSPDGTRLAVVRTTAARNTLQLWVGKSTGADLHPVGRPFAGTDATIDW